MRFLIILLVLVAFEARADSSSLNLAIPTSPQSYQSDRFRAGDLDCSQAIGSSTNVEFGVVGLINQNNPYYEAQQLIGQNIYQDRLVKDVGVYARIIIPLDKPKERINCNSLYQLELRVKRLEVLKLQQEINALKRMNSQTTFEN